VCPVCVRFFVFSRVFMASLVFALMVGKYIVNSGY
jgi:hypothetical protein